MAPSANKPDSYRQNETGSRHAQVDSIILVVTSIDEVPVTVERKPFIQPGDDERLPDAGNYREKWATDHRHKTVPMPIPFLLSREDTQRGRIEPAAKLSNDPALAFQ
ncbi:uncharacterized protein BCR38DRAFT_517945 [Pseudomassariella vexata]|uniref:Uncharacterized protein n=1 Tax=Pseudomassariella vexata TaxID=1141098 RepID=A0A1Y2DT32_9PEZI|nr:uncharacterized protein BCR38DRAFT_517945 [Pseudomassariella vexata]ORY62420.1 hypothetical protein BCR38DRAFT_517945 [Pseudomassariella vexata]